MGLALKHIIRTKAGTFHYRRRIPKDAADVLGKAEFKRRLGETEREALRNYPKINAEYERSVIDARARLLATADAHAETSSPRNLTDLELHRLAKRRAAELEAMKVYVGDKELTGADQEGADVIREGFLSSGSDDDVERQAVNLVANRGCIARPSPTLEDAKRLYVKERITGDINEKQKLNQLNLVMTHVSASVSLSRPLSSLTRDDAREVRDYMLRDLGISAASVKRYLNTITAVINLGMTEYEITERRNPFHGLPVRLESSAIEQRSPIPAKMLKAIRERLSGNAGEDMWRIWRIIEGTGCRISEVTGLLVGDVHLDAPIPYINLVHHRHRRLKNDASVRRVPLIGEAFKAMKEAVSATEGSFLFPRYGRVRGGEAASAIIMKHVRTVTSDPKIVIHSLRHTMADRLIRARVSEYDRNMILGHTNRGEGDRYGGPDARLEVAAAAVKAALGTNG
ncbi:tyrosine-type recombinase/integrase [Agrobacterium tumefaciens]|uniref:tyrosine-type recombinase/integrase n=1 Tax=Agrobacterium tumefaciens TaxID=358 RepID=UPI0010497152|nr:tyrosine-type recombinase/integrase [Agrobacterium tumefaciens]TCV55146.1 site-specific recombinase XerD [Agrobacterium tumefaciens]